MRSVSFVLSACILLASNCFSQSFTEKLKAKLDSGVVAIYAYNTNDNIPVKSGSGVVISEDGYIITNAHVVRGGNFYFIIKNHVLKLQSRINEIIYVDDCMDIAFIKIDNFNGKKIEIGNSDKLNSGAEVFAEGAPLGIQNVMTSGLYNDRIDTKCKEDYGGGEIKWLLHSAPINGGNSGGALVNRNGKLIGINNASALTNQNQPTQGLSYAIPISDIRRLISNTTYSWLAQKLQENDLVEQTAEIDDHKQFLKSSKKCYECNGKGTISVQGICINCKGTGSVNCPTCLGKGGETCSSCHGTGKWNLSSAWGSPQTCSTCSGRGIISTCKSCAGKGIVTCSVCNGKKIATTDEICPICNGKGELVKAINK